MVAESIYFSYAANVTFHGKELIALMEFVYSPDTVAVKIYTPIAFFKTSIVFIFILMRAHEQETLLLFCVFQKRLRVEDLYVFRD